MSDRQPGATAEHVGAGGVAAAAPTVQPAPPAPPAQPALVVRDASTGKANTLERSIEPGKLTKFPEGPAADAEAQALLDLKLAQSRITRDEHAAMSRQLRQAACAQQELVDAWRDKPPQELAEHVLRTEFGRMCIAVHSHKTMRTEDPAGPYTAYFISVECGSGAGGSGSSWTLKRRYSDFHALHKATRRDAKLVGLPFPPKKWMGGLSDDGKVARRAGLHAFMNEALEAASELLLPTLQEVRGAALLLLLPPPPPPPPLIPLLVVVVLLLLMMMRADILHDLVCCPPHLRTRLLCSSNSGRTSRRRLRLVAAVPLRSRCSLRSSRLISSRACMCRHVAAAAPGCTLRLAVQRVPKPWSWGVTNCDSQLTASSDRNVRGS